MYSSFWQYLAVLLTAIVVPKVGQLDFLTNSVLFHIYSIVKRRRIFFQAIIFSKILYCYYNIILPAHLWCRPSQLQNLGSKLGKIQIYVFRWQKRPAFSLTRNCRANETNLGFILQIIPPMSREIDLLKTTFFKTKLLRKKAGCTQKSKFM